MKKFLTLEFSGNVSRGENREIVAEVASAVFFDSEEEARDYAEQKCKSKLKPMLLATTNYVYTPGISVNMRYIPYTEKEETKDAESE